MMPYDIRVSHITSEYTIEPDQTQEWSVTLSNRDEIILLLNRIAIATTQYPVVEFPEVKITRETRRVIIRAISGQLYYSEVHSDTRKDLKVIPEEAIRLLEGQSIEQAFARKEEVEAYLPGASQHSRSSKLVSRLIMSLCTVIFFAAAFYSWSVWSQTSSLITTPRFIHILENEGELFREYADVYISEQREGAMVFELLDDGTLTIYELWFSTERNRFVLFTLESHRVLGGLQGGEPALLAGDFHLFQLASEGMVLHGTVFTRYHKPLSTLGEVMKSRQL